MPLPFGGGKERRPALHQEQYPEKFIDVKKKEGREIYDKIARALTMGGPASSAETRERKEILGIAKRRGGRGSPGKKPFLSAKKITEALRDHQNFTPSSEPAAA